MFTTIVVLQSLIAAAGFRGLLREGGRKKERRHPSPLKQFACIITGSLNDCNERKVEGQNNSDRASR